MTSDNPVLLEHFVSPLSSLLARVSHWMARPRRQSAAGDRENLINYARARALFEKQDYATALICFEKLARRGDAQAQLQLAQMYDHGYGVIPDVYEAFHWYREAAGQGLMEAQYQLGVCYLYGYGVTLDAGEAYVWFCRAAVQGHVSAMSNLALLYRHGLGVPQDVEEARLWSERAALRSGDRPQTAIEA